MKEPKGGEVFLYFWARLEVLFGCPVERCCFLRSVVVLVGIGIGWYSWVVGSQRNGGALEVSPELGWVWRAGMARPLICLVRGR